jgi:hypothetical protein
MSKHTPGPWKAETFAGRINVWPVTRRKPNGTAIAYECSKDDARLIAAAPELLAALRPFANLADWPELTAAFAAQVLPHERQPLLDAFANARALIAKATGETA